MDRWMDGGTFMASVSRGQSHFAREHSKRWHTKNSMCLATWLMPAPAAAGAKIVHTALIAAATGPWSWT